MQFDVSFFLSFVFNPRPALLLGLLTTISTTAVSMAFGMFLGLPLSLCGLSRFRPLRWFNATYIFVFRGTPLLVQVILIYFGLPYLINLDLFPQTVQVFGLFSVKGAIVAGVVAFVLHEAAFISEIARASIAAVDDGQRDAGKAVGMPPALLMKRIILPQAVRTMLPPLGNQVNGMFKATSLLYLIAVPEMMFIADAVNSVTYKTFEVYLGVSVYYLALTTAWGFVQRDLERRYSKGFMSI
ncbi:amino acid ABC transporter permease [Agrobacterium vitis]|uniref:amino acid ABC transporter permease n=1 Tax=Agrobacterium vitis TaxID=373 RepID=UPI002034DCEB|nr:amino acid ABC transporter permease [Agrobacterium vitis]MCM2453708.1 amino acid ABC transporter permease [Agrobacterium vitis]